MIFIFLSCHEKAHSNREFSSENSKPCCESRITTRLAKPCLFLHPQGNRSGLRNPKKDKHLHSYHQHSSSELSLN